VLPAKRKSFVALRPEFLLVIAVCYGFSKSVLNLFCAMHDYGINLFFLRLFNGRAVQLLKLTAAERVVSEFLASEERCAFCTRS
jgi:hypothetical protein